MRQDIIVIIDLGSEHNAQLARSIRYLGVYSEIHNFDITPSEINSLINVRGIILNHGPNNIVDNIKISVNSEVLDLGYPVLKLNGNWDSQQLNDFIFTICKAEANWNMANFIADQIDLIRNEVKDNKVILALSGGVDSSVVAALLHKAIKDNLYCVHVNHGLMREGESEQVIQVFKNQLDTNLIYVDAADRFLNKLEGISDPEQKRKIIGSEFIRVFEDESKKLKDIKYLAQGTIYPDIVESGTKTAKNVKSHHNVGGLPEDLAFKLVEPLKMLFKDEVRACGIELGLPPKMVYRQPFPGPGLGVRCLGAIDKARLNALRHADSILLEEFEKNGLTHVWQYFVVIPDFKSVGVRNNERTFQWPVIIRAVNTVDAMTATIEEIDYKVLHVITNRILSEVDGVNRVLYDLTPKPCGTIEWE